MYRLRYLRQENGKAKLLTNWYIQENICEPLRISLVGLCFDALIRTSPVVSIQSSRRVVTTNGVYLLGRKSSVMDHPLKCGRTAEFKNGFPKNWKELLEGHSNGIGSDAICANEGSATEKDNNRGSATEKDNNGGSTTEEDNDEKSVNCLVVNKEANSEIISNETDNEEVVIDRSIASRCKISLKESQSLKSNRSFGSYNELIKNEKYKKDANSEMLEKENRMHNGDENAKENASKCNEPKIVNASTCREPEMAGNAQKEGIKANSDFMSYMSTVNNTVGSKENKEPVINDQPIVKKQRIMNLEEALRGTPFERNRKPFIKTVMSQESKDANLAKEDKDEPVKRSIRDETNGSLIVKDKVDKFSKSEVRDEMVDKFSRSEIRDEIVDKLSRSEIRDEMVDKFSRSEIRENEISTARNEKAKSFIEAAPVKTEFDSDIILTQDSSNSMEPIEGNAAADKVNATTDKVDDDKVMNETKPCDHSPIATRSEAICNEPVERSNDFYSSFLKEIKAKEDNAPSDALIKPGDLPIKFEDSPLKKHLSDSLKGPNNSLVAPSPSKSSAAPSPSNSLIVPSPSKPLIAPSLHSNSRANINDTIIKEIKTDYSQIKYAEPNDSLLINKPGNEDLFYPKDNGLFESTLGADSVDTIALPFVDSMDIKMDSEYKVREALNEGKEKEAVNEDKARECVDEDKIRECVVEDKARDMVNEGKAIPLRPQMNKTDRASSIAINNGSYIAQGNTPSNALNNTLSSALGSTKPVVNEDESEDILKAYLGTSESDYNPIKAENEPLQNPHCSMIYQEEASHEDNSKEENDKKRTSNAARSDSAARSGAKEPVKRPRKNLEIKSAKGSAEDQEDVVSANVSLLYNQTLSVKRHSFPETEKSKSARKRTSSMGPRISDKENDSGHKSNEKDYRKEENGSKRNSFVISLSSSRVDATGISSETSEDERENNKREDSEDENDKSENDRNEINENNKREDSENENDINRSEDSEDKRREINRREDGEKENAKKERRPRENEPANKTERAPLKVPKKKKRKICRYVKKS